MRTGAWRLVPWLMLASTPPSGTPWCCLWSQVVILTDSRVGRKGHQCCSIFVSLGTDMRSYTWNLSNQWPSCPFGFLEVVKAGGELWSVWSDASGLEVTGKYTTMVKSSSERLLRHWWTCPLHVVEFSFTLHSLHSPYLPHCYHGRCSKQDIDHNEISLFLSLLCTCCCSSEIRWHHWWTCPVHMVVVFLSFQQPLHLCMGEFVNMLLISYWRLNHLYVSGNISPLCTCLCFCGICEHHSVWLLLWI